MSKQEDLLPSSIGKTLRIILSLTERVTPDRHRPRLIKPMLTLIHTEIVEIDSLRVLISGKTQPAKGFSPGDAFVGTFLRHVVAFLATQIDLMFLNETLTGRLRMNSVIWKASAAYASGFAQNCKLSSEFSLVFGRREGFEHPYSRSKEGATRVIHFRNFVRSY